MNQEILRQLAIVLPLAFALLLPILCGVLWLIDRIPTRKEGAW